jgi:hypothetical protein
MLKFIVICGPSLGTLTAMNRLNEIYHHSHGLAVFPEGDMGANSVREMVKGRVCQFQVDSTNEVEVIFTRYGDALWQLGECISNDLLHPDEVEIHLLDNEDDWSVHTFDYKGVINAGWPFGILS